jgi:hypothetical protein
MTSALAGLFVTGIELVGWQRMVLMLPLCLSIAIVYKTIRCENMRQMPTAAVGLWITIVLGMYAVGVGLWAVFETMV